MDPSLKLAFDEIFRRFDELDARMERRFSRTLAAPERRFSRTLAAPEQRGAAIEPRISSPEKVDASQLVVADNWGGLFDEVSAAAPDATSTGSDASPVAPASEFAAADSTDEPVRMLDFQLGPVEYALPTKPSQQPRETVAGLHLLATDEIEHIPVPDKELDEKRGREFLVGDLSALRPPRLRRLQRSPPHPSRIRVGQALPAAPALRADALGAAGGGLLAWVVAARSAQATCSMVRPAGDQTSAVVSLGSCAALVGSCSAVLVYTYADGISNPSAKDDGANNPVDPGPKFASLVRGIARLLDEGTHVVHLFWKLGLYGVEDIHILRLPDSIVTCTCFLYGGEPQRFKHSIPAAALIPKLCRGNSSTASSESPDIPVRHADREDALPASSEALEKQATKEPFVQAYELIVPICLPCPEDFLNIAECCTYTPTNCSTQVFNGSSVYKTNHIASEFEGTQDFTVPVVARVSEYQCGEAFYSTCGEALCGKSVLVVSYGHSDMSDSPHLCVHNVISLMIVKDGMHVLPLEEFTVVILYAIPSSSQPPFNASKSPDRVQEWLNANIPAHAELLGASNSVGLQGTFGTVIVGLLQNSKSSQLSIYCQVEVFIAGNMEEVIWQPSISVSTFACAAAWYCGKFKKSPWPPPHQLDMLVMEFNSYLHIGSSKTGTAKAMVAPMRLWFVERWVH